MYREADAWLAETRDALPTDAGKRSPPPLAVRARGAGGARVADRHLLRAAAAADGAAVAARPEPAHQLHPRSPRRVHPILGRLPGVALPRGRPRRLPHPGATRVPPLRRRAGLLRHPLLLRARRRRPDLPAAAAALRRRRRRPRDHRRDLVAGARHRLGDRLPGLGRRLLSRRCACLSRHAEPGEDAPDLGGALRRCS